MKIKDNILLKLCALCSALFMVACTAEEPENDLYKSKDVTLQLSRTIETSVLQGFLFDAEGNLVQSFENIRPSDDGHCTLSLSYGGDATLCLLGDGKDLLAGEVRSLSQLKGMVVEKPADSGLLPMWATSETAVKAGEKALKANLRRGLVRLDLNLSVSGVKVYELEVKKVYDKTFLYPSAAASSPEGSSPYDLKKTWKEPLVQSEQGVFYIFEQPRLHAAQEVIVRAEINGRMTTLRGKLPSSLERNKAYTISVKGEGVNISVDVTGDGWEDGQDTDASLDGRGWIDTDASQLLGNVTVNSYKDTVKVGYLGTGNEEAVVALNMPSSEHVTVESSSGEKENVQLEEHDGKYRVRIKSSKRYIGSLANYVYVRHYDKDNVLQGQIVLNFENNPIKVSGNIYFADTPNMEFTDYIDGTMGFVHLPEGYRMEVSAPAYEDEPEAQWMKAEKTDDGAYRIVAGWRPNDVRAKGQPQKAVLKIYNKENVLEEYTIVRPNWNLPVVKIKDTWWCKYNLRGNVKSFKDQVSMEKDAEIGKDLAAYLSSCPDEEYASLMGGQYQAGKHEALKLMQDAEGRLYYEGFTKTNVNFATLPPTEMAPTGFQLPTYDDYRFFAWGEDCNLGYDVSRFDNRLSGDRQQNIECKVFSRSDLKIGDIDYGTVSFYDFRFADDKNVSWVLLGLGHQWEVRVDAISRMYVLLAAYGCDRTWGMEGYTREDVRGNWYKYAPHNAFKTRTIRCIKSPVEFTY